MMKAEQEQNTALLEKLLERLGYKLEHVLEVDRYGYLMEKLVRDASLRAGQADNCLGNDMAEGEGKSFIAHGLQMYKSQVT